MGSKVAYENWVCAPTEIRSHVLRDSHKTPLPNLKRKSATRHITRPRQLGTSRKLVFLLCVGVDWLLSGAVDRAGSGPVLPQETRVSGETEFSWGTTINSRGARKAGSIASAQT